MILRERIALMTRLGEYILQNGDNWQETKEQAYLNNSWFIPEYIDLATNNIARNYLQQPLLEKWLQPYPNFSQEEKLPEVGIVMAGNIPLVGFHDFLAVFLSGCSMRIKLSSKDKTLWNHIIERLTIWQPEIAQSINFSEQLKSCDAYIATGSNNSARYFNYYFEKYPHIIRNNRSSLAILDGTENEAQLAKLADDICLYFGLGCRNVTQLLVPKNYDFAALKTALKKYEHHLDYSKYKNNYDYQLALLLLNKVKYEPAGPLLLTESDSLFAPIGVLHYQEYEDRKAINAMIPDSEQLQCVLSQRVLGNDYPETIPFGNAQFPQVTDYADQVNTLSFLNNLKKS